MGQEESLKTALEELQTEYSKTKYNKATNKYLGILRAKISTVKKEIIESGKGKRGSGFFVKRSGDATVALVGFPSAGKSSLINALTNAKSKIADYAFTTTTIIPGMLAYRNARIQVFDLPGVIKGAHIGAGGGKTVISASKVADLIIFVVDATSPEQLDTIIQEFKELDIYINRPKPDISIQETKTGFSLEVNKSGLDKKTVQTIFNGFGMYNCMIKIRSAVDDDELMAFASKKSSYIKALVALNKIDLVSNYSTIANSISKKYHIDVFPISIVNNANIGVLTDGIYGKLDIMTVYLKPRIESEKAEPMILKCESTVADAAKKIHTKLIEGMKSAYINGPSAKFKNQRVGPGHVLKDGDKVTFKSS
jgi:hypothetical protein